MVGPDGLTFGFFKALTARADFYSSEQTGDTPVSPSPCSQTNFPLVRAVITYIIKTLHKGGFLVWWVQMDSNQRPDRYERPALTN